MMIVRVGCAQNYKQGNHGWLGSRLSPNAAVLGNLKMRMLTLYKVMDWYQQNHSDTRQSEGMGAELCTLTFL